jgi:hypothetical protein
MTMPPTITISRPDYSHLTFTWSVTSLKTKNEGSNESAVVQTYWKKIGTDAQGNTGEFSGATPFTSTTMPEGDTFVPFSELTEEIVLGWIKDVVVGSYEDHVNGKIAEQIDAKVNVITEAELPWSTPSA